MRALLKRLYRERRRLLVVAVLTFLGGYLAFYKSVATLMGFPMWLVAGLAFMIGLTTFLMVIVVLFPKLRHCAESAALAVPVLSLMGLFSGAESGGISTAAGLYMALFAWLFFTVYAGTLADTYLPRRVHRFRSQALSRLGREELWPYLFVTPDTVGEYGDDDTLSMDWIEPGKTFRHVVRSGNLAKIEEIVSIETLEPNAFLKLAFNVPDAAENAPVSSGFYEVSLSNSTQGTLVQSVREFDRVTLRTRLFVWVDDAFGRQEDISILRAEKAVRKRQASA